MNQLDLDFSINRINDYTPNATKCKTWQDVKASHQTDNPEVIIILDDIYGMMILLATGLCGALFIFALELSIKAWKERSMKNWLAAPSSYLLIKFWHNFQRY